MSLFFFGQTGVEVETMVSMSPFANDIWDFGCRVAPIGLFNPNAVFSFPFRVETV